MSDQYYYLRKRGIIAGPFDLDQFKEMRLRRQFARFDQVSIDGQNWLSAKTLTEVFRSDHEPDAPLARPPTPLPGPTPIGTGVVRSRPIGGYQGPIDPTK